MAQGNPQDTRTKKDMVPPVLERDRIAKLQPLRPVTGEEITAFRRDGVVKLAGILLENFP